MSSCASSRIGRHTTNLSYKLLTNSSFNHWDVAYLDGKQNNIVFFDLEGTSVTYHGGKVSSGYVASVSSTGYQSTDSSAYIEVQILLDGKVVSFQRQNGTNPSLAVSYVVP